MRDQSYIMAVAASTAPRSTSSPTATTPPQPSSPSDYAAASSPHRVSADHSMPRFILPRAGDFFENFVAQFSHSESNVQCYRFEFFCLVFAHC